MACCLFGAKPLLEPMLTYCHWDHQQQISLPIPTFFIQENSYKKSADNCQTFHSDVNVLMCNLLFLCQVKYKGRKLDSYKSSWFRRQQSARLSEVSCCFGFVIFFFSKLNPCRVEVISGNIKDIFMFSIISQHLDIYSPGS